MVEERTIKISKDAFNFLKDGKQKLINVAEQKNDKDLVKTLSDMDIGAFAEWILYRFFEKERNLKSTRNSEDVFNFYL